LGWIYYKKKVSELAVKAFGFSATRAPREPTYHYHLGLAQIQAGDPARGRASLERALALNKAFAGADDARRVLIGLAPAAQAGR
jgi:hypothetical protein